MKTLLLALLMMNCSSQSESIPKVSVAGLGFDEPEGWTHSEAKEVGKISSRWYPARNEHKESISIIRAILPIKLKGASVAYLGEVLSAAQRTLPSPAVESPASRRTKQDLVVVQVASDFVPPGLTVSYHRVHAILIDGETLINVIYTAREPDLSLAVFSQIVESIHSEKS